MRAAGKRVSLLEISFVVLSAVFGFQTKTGLRNVDERQHEFRRDLRVRAIRRRCAARAIADAVCLTADPIDVRDARAADRGWMAAPRSLARSPTDVKPASVSVYNILRMHCRYRGIWTDKIVRNRHKRFRLGGSGASRSRVGPAFGQRESLGRRRRRS